MRSRVTLILALLCVVRITAQEGWSKAQLLSALKEKIADSTRLDILNELTWPVYSYTHFDSSVYFGQQAITLAEKTGDRLRSCVAHRRIGITYSNFGKLREAIHHGETSYAIADSLGFERGKFLALNNIGVAYLNCEQLNSALEFFLRCTVLAEKSGDNNFLARLYMNIGNIYRRLLQHDKARKYFQIAGRFAEASGQADSRVNALCNLASTYRVLGKIDSARACLDEAGRLSTGKVDVYTKMNLALANGQLLSVSGHHTEALVEFQKALQFSGGLSDEITLLINIAEQYQNLQKYAAALEYYQKAFRLSEQNRMYDNLQYITWRMGEVYDRQGDYRNYTTVMKKYVVYRDSNENINKAQEIISRQLQFDYQRKHVADSVRFRQQEDLRLMELQMTEARLDREKLIKVFLFAGIALLLGLAIFVSNRLRLTHRQKQIIEKQKKIVEQRNREITDSINYAWRLQSAMLPQRTQIRKYLDYDIFYQPKDIIGGDFYFFQHVRGKFFVAVCDCTGHGIPGALMSVVCHEALCDAILEHELDDPAAILVKTREIIIENLNAREQNIHDGMEASLLVIDPVTRNIEWCGAFTPLWYCSAGLMHEVKGDKQSVSYSEKQGGFTTKKILAEFGSTFYLFTDGYADQFGGPDGKKFKYKPMKELLHAVYRDTVGAQAEHLRKNFTDWKADLEQVDDVAVGVIRF